MVSVEPLKNLIEDKLVELMGRGFLTELELELKLGELARASNTREAGNVIKSLLIEEMVA